MLLFINRFAKTIILLFGMLVFLVLLGLGGAALYFKDNAAKLYIDTRKSIDSSFDSSQAFIDTYNGSSSKFSVESINKQIEEVKKKVEESTKKLEEYEKQINQAKGLNGYLVSPEKLKELQEAKKSLQATKSQIEKYANTLKTANNGKTGQNGTSSSTIPITKISGSTISVSTRDTNGKTNSALKDIQEFSTQANDIIKQYKEIKNKIPTEKQFNEYYTIVAITLVSVSGGVLAVLIVSTVMTFLGSKKLGLRTFSRLTSTDQIADHVNDILDRYQELEDAVLEELDQ